MPGGVQKEYSKRKSIMSYLSDNIDIKKNLTATNTTTACREVTYKNNIIAPKGFYYYGFPGEEYDQALMSTKFPNTRGRFLTNSLRNAID